MKIDERLETLCEQFAGLEEPEKDYILGVSQTLAHSIKGTMPPPVTVERVIPEYEGLSEEDAL
jgi:hypothetical protein